MQDLLGDDAPLYAIYANGYGPDAPAQSWRKPSPRMLEVASVDLNLDLNRSILIGDRLTDLQAGSRAGISKLFHVITGHGLSARPSVLEWIRSSDSNFQLIGTNSGYHSVLQLLDNLGDFPFPVLQSM